MFLFCLTIVLYAKTVPNSSKMGNFFQYFLLWYVPFYKVLICAILSLRYFFILSWLIGCSLFSISLLCYRCY